MRLRHELFAGLVVLASTAPTCLAADGLTLPKDVVLPANVAVAIRATGATAVDVSSGVERARGVKDAGLIRAFIANARNAQMEPSPSALP